MRLPYSRGPFTGAVVALHSTDSRYGRLGTIGNMLFGDRISMRKRAERRFSTVAAKGTWVINPVALLEASIDHGTGTESFRAIDQPAASGNQYRFVDRGHFTTAGAGVTHERRTLRRWRGSISHNQSFSIRDDGTHKLSIGIAVEEEKDTVRDALSGEALIDIVPTTPLVYIYRTWYSPHAGNPLSVISDTIQSRFLSGYIGDDWASPSGNIAVYGGIRYEQQSTTPDALDVSLRTQVWQPRFAITWAPRRVVSTAYATFARYANLLDAEARLALFSTRRFTAAASFDGSIVHNTRAEELLGSRLGSYGGVVAVDDNTRGAFSDELTIGITRQLRETMVLRLNLLRQTLGQYIEDYVCTADGHKCIGNPGFGQMATLSQFYGGNRVAIPPPRRERHSITIGAEQQRRWKGGPVQWTLNYTWSQVEGTIDDDVVPRTHLGIDIYSRPAYDYYEFLTGSTLSDPIRQRPLSADRRHYIFGFASYTRSRMTYEVDASWATGTPVQEYGYSDLYGRYVYLYDSRLRTPATTDVNVRISHHIPVEDAVATVFVHLNNLLNTQAPTVQDGRRSFAENEAIAANPWFGLPLTRREPLRLWVGMRFQF